MSHRSRFDLSFDKPEKPLPPLAENLSEEETLDQLVQEICDHAPELAEILFSVEFSTQTKDERVARIRNWDGE